jgi:hypothetical protein
MELLEDYQSGFRSNQIFCIRQILNQKWEYNETVHQLLIDFRKACDSIRREVFNDILIDYGVPMKLARLIKICLNEHTVMSI